MPKELPYLKFNVSEWISGTITLESFEAQGVFINICAYYWFKSGELTLTEIKRRVKCKQAIYNTLVDSNLIKLNGDFIKISFLDEQLSEINIKREKNKINGSKGGAPVGNKNAEKNNPNTTQIQAKTTNIDKDKEEDKDKDKRVVYNNFSDDLYQSASEAFEEIKNDQIQMERLLMIVRNSGFRGCNEVTMTLAMKHFFTVESAKPGFLNRPRDDIKQHLVNWTNKNAKTIDQYAK